MKGAFANEPVADFSKQVNRDAMQSALTEVAGQFGRTYPLVNAGKTVATESSIELRQPSRTKQLLCRCGPASVAHARSAIDAADAPCPAWRDTATRARTTCL